MSWMKVPAAADALRRWPGAEWLFVLDTDAAPRALGLGPGAVARWAAAQALDD
eukprot:gene7862-8954_t